MKNNRELAAILFTDVSGFTSTMDTDENLAMDRISRHKEIVSLAIQSYNGKLIKDMGDGLFVKFSSAVDSVQCAINIQQLINVENFSIRIGIHLGEIIIKNDIEVTNTLSHVRSLAPSRFFMAILKSILIMKN